MLLVSRSLRAVEHACESMFAVAPDSGIFDAARDGEPVHAEASGHPKVGSSDSQYAKNIADTSIPAWKIASSK